MRVFCALIVFSFFISYSVNAQTEDSYKEKFEEKAEEVGALKYQLKSLQADTAKLFGELKKTRETLVQLKDIERERDSINDRLESLEKELREKSGRLDAIKDDKDYLEKRYNDLKDNSGNIEAIISTKNDLNDSLTQYKAVSDSLRLKADSLPSFKREKFELELKIAEQNSQIDSLNDEIVQKDDSIKLLKQEVKEMRILKKEKINYIEEEVNRIVLSSNFSPHYSKLIEVDTQINEFIEYFPDDEKLLNSRKKINTFKGNIQFINQATDVLNVKYNSTEVNSAIKNLSVLENPSQAMISEKEILLKKLTDYCRYTNKTYSVIKEVDNYGSSKFKKDHIDSYMEVISSSYPYLISALNQKKENGYKNGPVALLPETVKCN